MSKLSFMEKLLDGVEVEWKALGEVTKKISSGKNKEKCEDGLYPVYGSTGIIGRSNNTAFTSQQVLVARVGANAGYVHIGTGKYDVSDNTLIIQNDDSINMKYLYYYLINIRLNRFAQGAGQPLITGKQLKTLGIPIPCPENPTKSLGIQAEIVRILDTFTELTARKKQYSYYRDKLLSFDEGEACLSGRQVEWKPLGLVGKICRGTAITKKQTNPGNYPVIANGPSHNYYHDQSNRDGETIVIARSGAYAGLVSYWDIPFFLTDAFSIHPDNVYLSTRFLYYVLKNDQTQIHNMGTGAGVPHVRAKDFESYKVPIPLPVEQNRIVSILDKFDALTNSITEGLPREIELRQKQYEYYRDLLLTFPKAEAE